MDEQAIFARIEKLESQCARLKLLVVVLFCMTIATFIFYRSHPAKSLIANEFLIKDPNGKTVAKLSYEHGQACLQLNGQDRIAGADLCAGDLYGSSLLLTDQKRRSRAYLSAGAKLTEGGGALDPGLVIADRDGENVVSAAAGRETRLLVGHGNEKSSLLMSVPEGKPTFAISTESGKIVWSVP